MTNKNQLYANKNLLIPVDYVDCGFNKKHPLEVR